METERGSSPLWQEQGSERSRDLHACGHELAPPAVRSGSAREEERSGPGAGYGDGDGARMDGSASGGAPARRRRRVRSEPSMIGSVVRPRIGPGPAFRASGLVHTLRSRAYTRVSDSVFKRPFPPVNFGQSIELSVKVSLSLHPVCCPKLATPMVFISAKT